MLTLRVLLGLTFTCLLFDGVDPQISGGSAFPACKIKQDTIFLLQSSSSIGKKNFNIMLKMVAQMSAMQPIGPQADQIGVEIFATTAATKIRLKDHSSSSTLKEAILNINFMGGLSNLHRGLNHMCRIGFSRRNGDRIGVPNIGIIIYNGRFTNPNLVIEAVIKCLQRGIQLLFIQVGRNDGTLNILPMRTNSQILSASTFAELLEPGFLKNITAIKCRATP